VILVAALAIGGLTLGQPAGEDGPSRRTPATEAKPIDLPALTGEGRVSLQSLRGRPVVVNLFASWCAPCRKELPAFREVSEELGDKVAFLGVNHQDTRQGGQDMLAEFRIRYPAGYDPDGKVALDYALLGMPSTLFVSADGKLLETHTGELDRQRLEEMISRLFGII
jgi:cytochrome c biogenesis protein CcmG/thiol:disulfide interchange protein DsbE